MSASNWRPSQKKPPMQPGMITNSTRGNLNRNSHQLVFMDEIFFNIVITPTLSLRNLQ